MTNYNDGKWHSWAGGDRPIHCNSIIEAIYVTDLGVKMDLRSPAGDLLWDSAFLFRVVEEHKELREFWVLQCDHTKEVLQVAEGTPMSFLVREVLE